MGSWITFLLTHAIVVQKPSKLFFLVLKKKPKQTNLEQLIKFAKAIYLTITDLTVVWLVKQVLPHFMGAVNIFYDS